jgi:hypothetical protein
MSSKDFTRRRNTVGLGIAAGAAFATAAMIGLGSAPAAHADDTLTPDGYSDLFGASGPQAADDHSLDLQLFDQNPGTAASFDQAVDTFQASDAHGIADLIYALDPSAFTVATDPDIVGTLAGGGYLVPDDFLGYLATDLDFFLLNPTGLDPLLLAPVIDTLLGSPPF